MLHADGILRRRRRRVPPVQRARDGLVVADRPDPSVLSDGPLASAARRSLRPLTSRGPMRTDVIAAAAE